MQAVENLGKYNSTVQAGMDAVQKEGVVRVVFCLFFFFCFFFLSLSFTSHSLKGLYRGFAPMAIRNAVWNGTYFGVIGYIRSSSFAPKHGPNGKESKMDSFIVGVIGGSAGEQRCE